jgi:aminoglycoside/choline kinase family phosphotransferase
VDEVTRHALAMLGLVAQLPRAQPLGFLSVFSNTLLGAAMKERLLQLFQDRFGHRPNAFLDLQADASTRRYFRMVGDGGFSAVGAIGPDKEENRAFLSFAKAFGSVGLPVPEVFAEDQDAGVWLLEDLGDATLFKVLSLTRPSSSEDTFPPQVEALYRKVLSILPKFQVTGHGVIDYSLAYPRRAFDEQSMRWDLNYFKYHFLKLSHLDFSEQRLEDDFDRLIALLLQADSEFFLYRDFQSRNIMIRGEDPWFIDFQGGRKGPLQYDVASLLYDAKANIPEEVRGRLLDSYLASLEEHISVDRTQFLVQFRGFVLIRIMQALGAYGYRGFFEQKRHFLDSVPFAARNIRNILDAGMPTPLPELERVLGTIVDRWAESNKTARSPGKLNLLVQSFSYKKGYPADQSGHGGGQVFDCRALPNPGRIAKFRELTGEDQPVIDYLEGSTEVQECWSHVREIVDAHVANFLSRSFDSLTVSFGCTGGQHRSVYFAGKLGAHIRTRFPQVELSVTHREQ